MISVTSASHYITEASRYHPRYQSSSSIYIRGLIPRNFAELAEAVPIDFLCVFIGLHFTMKRGAIHFASGLSLGLVLMSIRFSYMSISESRAAMLRRPVRYDTATHLGAKAAPPDKLLLIQEDVERIQGAIKPVQLNDKEQHHGRMI